MTQKELNPLERLEAITNALACGPVEWYVGGHPLYGEYLIRKSCGGITEYAIAEWDGSYWKINKKIIDKKMIQYAVKLPDAQDLETADPNFMNVPKVKPSKQTKG